MGGGHSLCIRDKSGKWWGKGHRDPSVPGLLIKRVGMAWQMGEDFKKCSKMDWCITLGKQHIHLLCLLIMCSVSGIREKRYVFDK